KRFAALEKKLAHRKGYHVYSPGGLAASIGRRTYGKKAFQKMAIAGKKRAAAKRKASCREPRGSGMHRFVSGDDDMSSKLGAAIDRARALYAEKEAAMPRSFSNNKPLPERYRKAQAAYESAMDEYASDPELREHMVCWMLDF